MYVDQPPLIAAIVDLSLRMFGSLLTMNAFEPLLWLALTVSVFAQIESPQGWRWPLIGIVVGAGMLNKWSMGMHVLSLAAGMALSPARRRLWGPGLGFAAAVAAAIAAPNVAWQALHGWPQFAVVHNADIAKNEHVSALLFLLEQLPLMNPHCSTISTPSTCGP